MAGTALTIATPSTASAAEPCIVGWSNTERSCAMAEIPYQVIWTLGNGICAGMLTVGGTAFDGPRFYAPADAMHGIELRISQGFSPIGQWGPQLLACDVNVTVDWHNLDTGQRGSMTRFVPVARTSTWPMIMDPYPGKGRVQVSVRTDHPSVPANFEVVVP